MPPLATLGQVKPKLGIASSDSTRDAELTLALQASEARVVSATRLSFLAEPREEYLRLVREGDLIRTERRPIDTALPVTVEGRDFGSGSGWVTLDADVVDPAGGRIRVGGTSTGAGWPPTVTPIAWRPTRWRRREWPLVRVRYTSAIAELSADLSDIVASLAAFYSGAAAAAVVGGVQSETAGDVSVTYATASSSSGSAPAIPALISTRLIPYMAGDLVRGSR